MALADASENALGRYLRVKRTAAELTLRDVADALGVTHVFISKVERGIRTSLTPERLQQLEAAIPGFSAEEAERVARGEVEPPPDPPFEPLGAAIVRRLAARPGMKRKELAELFTATRLLLGVEP